MKCDTNGEIIPEMLDICDCGLTCGCDKCRPFTKTNSLDKTLVNWSNLNITITIEDVRKITDKLPSLTKILNKEK